VRCSVLQCVAVCFSVSRCIAVFLFREPVENKVCVRHNCLLQCVAVCCSVLQCVADIFLGKLSRVMCASDMTVCCIVLQYDAEYSCVLQCFF